MNPESSYLVLCVLLQIIWATTADHPEKVTKLSYSPTEIIYIEDGFPKQRTYRLEDFFWTGSGDGAPEYPENPWAETKKIPTTVYKTKTIMSTVYISIMTVDQQQENTTEESIHSECAIDCESSSVPAGEISPTPTQYGGSSPPHQQPTVTTSANGTSTADRQYWLLTIIRTNTTEPVVTVLEKRLANLYSVAFRRQQEKHLGIGRRTKRNLKKIPVEEKPVNVHIYNISKDDHTVQVLYHVLVSGQPVSAVTAASDMRLVTDEEVATELGYPVLTKAEPYVKTEKPQGLARTRDTWLFVGAALAAIVILLLILTAFTLCLKKRNNSQEKNRPGAGLANRQRIFEKETGCAKANDGYVDEQAETKSYLSGKRHKKTGTKGADTLSGQYKRGTSIGSPSTSSVTSSESSNLSSIMITPKHKQFQGKKRYGRQMPKRTAALNKTLIQKQSAKAVDTDSSNSERKDSEVGLVKHSGKISPKSFLSMPSVKSFPRSSIPETLNRVLEPVSVLHLDIADDIVLEPSPVAVYHPGKMARHGSMGGEDPGVIGPVVWDMHCKRLQRDAAGTDEPEEAKSSNRMRRRFDELLDDTFTLFGSSNDSQDGAHVASFQSTKPSDYRGHSAANIARAASGHQVMPRPRPKTSDSRRVAPSPGIDPPRGAWASGLPSPLVRPLSAGPFHRPTLAPTVEVERILADGTLPPNDPAVPLIAAIKTELQKCALPGSTTNIAE